MKTLSIIAISILLVAGCATKPTATLPLSQEDNRIRNTIAVVNSNINGTYGSKNGKVFGQFNETEYKKLLEKGKSKPTKEMRDLYGLFSTKEFIAYPSTFIFCGFSPRMKIAFCDDSACEGVEYFERSETIDVMINWKKDLPLKACPSQTRKQ